MDGDDESGTTSLLSGSRSDDNQSFASASGRDEVGGHLMRKRTSREPSFKYVLPIIFLVFLSQGSWFTIVVEYRCKYYGASGSYVAESVFNCIGSAIGFAASPNIGALSDRIGRKPLIMFSILTNLVPPTMLNFDFVLKHFWIYDVLNTIGNVSGGLAFLCFAYASDVVPPKERGIAFAYVGTMLPLGLVIGAPFGLVVGRTYNYLAPLSLALLLPYVYYYMLETAGLKFERLRELEKEEKVELLLPDKVNVDNNDDIGGGGLGGRKRVLTLEDAPEIIEEELNKEVNEQLSEFTTCDKVTFIFRTDRDIIRYAAYAILFFNLGFSPIKKKLLSYMQIRFAASNTVRTAAVSMTGILGVFSAGCFAPFAQKRFGTRNGALLGFTLVFILFVGLGLSFEIWMVFVSLVFCIGGFMSAPLVTSMVSQAAGKKEQGAIVGAFQSMSSIADFVAPLVYGTLFSITSLSSSADVSCNSKNSSTINGDDSGADNSSRFIEGTPWLFAALLIFCSIFLLRRLPPEVEETNDHVDFVPDAATVLEPSEVRRQRAKSTLEDGTNISMSTL